MKSNSATLWVHLEEVSSPAEDVKELVEFKGELDRLRMNDKSKDTEHEVSEEDFFTVLRQFEEKNSATYEFISKAGLQFKLAILKLCRRFIAKETFTKRFNLTIL